MEQFSYRILNSKAVADYAYYAGLEKPTIYIVFFYEKVFRMFVLRSTPPNKAAVHVRPIFRTSDHKKCLRFERNLACRY